MSKKKSTPLSKEDAAKVKSLAAVALSDKTPTVEEVNQLNKSLNDIAEANSIDDPISSDTVTVVVPVVNKIGDTPVEEIEITVDKGDSDLVENVDIAICPIERIRNGEWREVLQELGSIEYNRIRLLALK